MHFLGGHWDLFSRGGTGVCFSPVEGGDWGLFILMGGPVYYFFFFPQLIFFFLIPDSGGTMAPAGPPIDPSLVTTSGIFKAGFTHGKKLCFGHPK
jgi:hypothetical protein